MAKRPLLLRLTLTAPPAGVLFSLQDKSNAPVDAALADGCELSLDLSVDVSEADGGLRFTGPFVRIGFGRKFVYFCSGTIAGRAGSPWTRRGKVMLDSLPPDLVRAALAAGARLEARIDGCAKDGGPACAAVALPQGWRQLPSA